jgi:hypothetical protein
VERRADSAAGAVEIAYQGRENQDEAGMCGRSDVVDTEHLAQPVIAHSIFGRTWPSLAIFVLSSFKIGKFRHAV